MLARLRSSTSLLSAGALLLGTARLAAGATPDASGLAQSAARPAAYNFARDVLPALTKAGCNSGACHGSLQGRGTLQLSLLGYDPAADYEALFKFDRGRRVFASAPEKSLLVQKAIGAMPHGGGRRIEVDSASYRLLVEYIGEGLISPAESDPHVVRLEVSPVEAVQAADSALQIKALAYWSDGEIRDVSPLALYDSRFKDVAEISATGGVTCLKPGRTALTVRYAGQVAAIPLTVPYASGSSAEIYARVPRGNFIDDLVIADWEKLGVQPAPLASDAEFLRRICLDLIGTLPTSAEVRAFVADSAADKRSRQIDLLLDRAEYVDHWALKWGDLLRVHRRYVGDKGLASFWGWVRRAVRENRPIDQLTRELLTAQGNLYTNGPVAYYFVDLKPEELAETTSQLFLGVRLQCTRCHRHPNEVWNQADYYGLAAYFTHLDVKENGDQGRFGGARIIRPTATENKKRRPAMAAEPHLFGMDNDDDNEARSDSPVSDSTDIRAALAESITSPDNPYFARNFANRYWSYVMGRGLVEPVDDLRATNPASNPALLDALAAEFVEHGYDAKHLLRLICNSRVYQLASEISPERDVEGMFYTHRVPRRMSAEALLDAINQATGTVETFTGIPVGTRAIALPDPAVPSHFLATFGRPLRNSPCECARGTMPDLSQALLLANSPALHEKLCSERGRLAQLLKDETPREKIVEELYLATFSRVPTESEQALVAELLAEAPSVREGLEDLLWTLLNSSEFVFNH